MLAEKEAPSNLKRRLERSCPSSLDSVVKQNAPDRAAAKAASPSVVSFALGCAKTLRAAVYPISEAVLPKLHKRSNGNPRADARTV